MTLWPLYETSALIEAHHPPVCAGDPPERRAAPPAAEMGVTPKVFRHWWTRGRVPKVKAEWLHGRFPEIVTDPATLIG